MLELFTTLLLALHLLAVNLAAAGPLVGIWLHGRAFRGGDQAADAAGWRLAWASFWALLGGTVLGFGLLGLGWLAADARYFDAIRLFPAHRYWFALAELGCSLLWLAGYAWLWRRLARYSAWHSLLAVLSSTNLLYHFPPLLAAIALAAARPDLADELAGATTIGWLKQPEILSRSVHFYLASLAVAGVALMGLGLRALRQATDEASTRRLIVAGARVALIPTLAQLLVGMWVVLALPRTAQDAVLGGDGMATGLLGAGILASLALMHCLSSPALGEVDRRLVVRAMLLLALVVLLMSGALRRIHVVRLSRGARVSKDSSMQTVPRYKRPPARDAVAGG